MIFWAENHPGSLRSLGGHHYLQESGLNNHPFYIRTTFKIKVYIGNLGLKRNQMYGGNSTGFKYQGLGSTDVLTLPSTDWDNLPNAASLILYFFIHGGHGVVETLILNEVVSCFTTAHYVCMRYLICSCHRKWSQTSLETGKLRLLSQNSTVNDGIPSLQGLEYIK